MNFGVACDGILKTVLLRTVLKIFWGAQENANFSGKLRSQKSVDRNSSFGTNIIPHKFQLGPILSLISFNWDPCFKVGIQHPGKSWRRHQIFLQVSLEKILRAFLMCNQRLLSLTETFLTWFLEERVFEQLFTITNSLKVFC